MAVSSRFGLQQRQRPQRLSSRLRPERVPAPAVPDTVGLEIELLEATALDVRGLVRANPEIGDSVDLQLPQEDDASVMLAGVVHWKEIRRQGYEIGVFLPDGLPAGAGGSKTDLRRQANRYRCSVAGRYQSSGSSHSGPAEVVNYSYGGFAIRTDAFCQVDELIKFEWTCEQTVQQISGQVLWQIEQQHGVLLGCQTGPGAGYRIAGINIT